jgi:integrase
MEPREKSYREKLNSFLKDRTICSANRSLFKEFFLKEETKLKRQNDLKELDEPCYKTLYGYIFKLSNVNKWFHNKPLKDITKADIKKVYDDLEDGKIVTKRGKRFKDKRSYYNKIFKSTLFRMIKKSEMACEVLETGTVKNNEEVRFTDEETIRKIIDIMIQPNQKLTGWLCFDIGENINAILQLRKKDCTRVIDPDTKLPEYRIFLRKETLKRSRKERSEITNFPETVKFLDIVLKDLKEDSLIFDFGYRNAEKFLDRAVGIVGATCEPKGQKVTWKDFRSSMACDLLRKDWTVQEINRRLGHRPSSSEIDKYVNHLAMDTHKPKKKVYEHNLGKIQAELTETRQREQLQARRMETMQEELLEIKKLLALQSIKS